MMQTIDHKAESIFYEVTLYFENGAWLFSTAVRSTKPDAAIELAEEEFFVHSAYHKLGNNWPAFACVTDECNNSYFSKRDRIWQAVEFPIRQVPPVSHKGFPLGRGE